WRDKNHTRHSGNFQTIFGSESSACFKNMIHRPIPVANVPTRGKFSMASFINLAPDVSGMLSRKSLETIPRFIAHSNIGSRLTEITKGRPLVEPVAYPL